MAASGRRHSFTGDLDQLRTCFKELDARETGHINYEQLRRLVESLPNMEESVVPDLWEKLDKDGDGKVTFDDFKRVFQEGETKKKRRKLMLPQIPIHRMDQSSSAMTSPSDSHYKTTVEDSGELFSGGTLETSAGSALLRPNRRRATMPSRLNRPRGSDLSMLSPIQNEKSPRKRPLPTLSPDMPDLASQMKHLTQAVDSPQLKRNSKVLSWIEESGDVMFEDTGTGLKGKEDLPSPPVSPLSKTSEVEVSHVKSILEEFCSTKGFDEEAVVKLCRHVDAEPQEEQELLQLVNQIDSDGKGFISVTEFARGLQSIRNAAKVGTSTPAALPSSMRRYNSELTPARYSDAFGSPLMNQHMKPQLSSTPSMPKLVTGDHSFSFLDPKETGSVKVEELLGHWQNMGVEAANEQEIENVISKSFPVDPSGRVSMSEMVASLEGSVLTDGKSPNILRQAAVKTFKKEISTLKNQVHQVSMERDKLKTSLNRTMEEKAKIIKEGDEHVDIISRNAEKNIKEQQKRQQNEMREKERLARQEILNIQEQAVQSTKDQKEKYQKLKRDGEDLRHELKYARDEKDILEEQVHSSQRKINSLEKTLEALQKDLGSRSDNDLVVDETKASHLAELEKQLEDKSMHIMELQDKHREIRDNYDELKADHERIKQKYYDLKRKNYRKSKTQSIGSINTAQQARQRLPSGDGRVRFRPLSGSHYHKRPRPFNSHVKTAIDLDLAVELPEADEDMFDDTDIGFSPPHSKSPEYDETPEDIESDSDTDNFAKSTASLLEEFMDQSSIEKLEEECKQQEEVIKNLKEEILVLEKVKQEKIKEVQETLDRERKSHEVEGNIWSNELHNTKSAVTELEAKKKQQEQEHEETIAKLRKTSMAEVQQLQAELAQVRASLTEHSEQQVAEIQRLKQCLQKEKDQLLKSSESYTELGEKHSEELEAIRYKLRVTVEELHDQLNKKEIIVEELQRILKRKENDRESMSSTLGILQNKEEEYKSQISIYENSESEYKSSIASLEKEIAMLLTKNSSQMATLRAELSKGMNQKYSTLQEQLEKLVVGCEAKLGDAQAKFAVLTSSLKDSDLQQANAVKTLLFDLHQSQREINTLKDETDLLRSELDTSHSEFDKLKKARDTLNDANMAMEEEIEEIKSKLDQAKRRRPISLVEADSGQVITEEDEEQLRDNILHEKESTIHTLRNEVESLKLAERQARLVGEEAARKVLEKDKELRQAKEKVELLQRDMQSFESKVYRLQNECNSHKEEVRNLNESFREVNQEHQKSKIHMELQSERTLEELKDKHLVDLNYVKAIVTSNQQDAWKLYVYLLETNGRTHPQVAAEQTQYSHAQLMLESMKEIDSIKKELDRQREACNELESLLEMKIREHEAQEVQFTAEHEEEVRALRQQKQQLMEKLDESKEHFENILESQDEENTSLKREFGKMKTDMDKELQHKTEEMYHVYQKVADLGEEKKVLVDVIKQLCVEAGRQIDIL